MGRRVNSIDELEAWRKEVIDGLDPNRPLIVVCHGTGCVAGGSPFVTKALKAALEESGVAADLAIEVKTTGCQGFCSRGPLVSIYPQGIFYQQVKPEDADEIVNETVKNGNLVDRLLYKDAKTNQYIPKIDDIPFYKLQHRLVLKNFGTLDPCSIEDSLASGGYRALSKALLTMTPDGIIDEVKTSYIRGRGGAGFPTGLKWRFARDAQGDVKYVLCNADEGDPGAFMDRSILEADPHAVLEGMVIAAKAIGSHQGYIYCRTEYQLAIERMNIAIAQAKESGLLGKNILGSGFDFDLEIYEGAGAFVCGEETALMASIEGRRGMPRPRPPFPAHQGLWKKPSILNNVETFANIGRIIYEGGAAYAAVGTETSKGSKVFALSGVVNNIGLVEVPMGIPIRTIIDDIGGGIPKKKKFKAVQLGGPSGGCVPTDHLDTVIDYEEIAKVGAIMGSGGMIVMDETTCMVDMARFFMEFIQDESCGKCTPCREGTRRMLDILEGICEGKGEPGDIEKLEELSEVIKESALCGLGQTGPNPVLSTLRYFRHEYEAHIYEKRCPAKRCAALLKFEIDIELCKKCGLCAKACPQNTIIWQKKEVAFLNKDGCVQCLSCYSVCPSGAIF
ncbi:MAG: NADH-quinone oxidoreductase subunit NuoF [Deltaproteobacteria bacterium]|nr:NADH-quinone oxidoreductase subunit NuoF [Deltaproteobacteria bacterium]